MLRRKGWKRVVTAGVLAASLGLLTACGGAKDADGQSDGAAPSGDAKEGITLVAWAGSETPIVGNFNPYAPTALHAAMGGVYEPLFFYNKSRADDPIPLLGEEATWSDDGTELTIKLREGVKWNDGEPFTAEDVEYSFTNEAVQTEYIEGIDIKDDHQLVLTFNEPSVTRAYTLLGATYIVPKHIFENLPDLVTFANDDNPVGTGPFMVGSVTDASYTMVPNPDYWDSGRPNIAAVQYLGIDGNSSAEGLFRAGDLDYATQFVPDPDDLIAAQDLGYLKVMSPNYAAVLICSNADLGCEGPQTDKAIRQALNVAIDRDEINEKAYYNLATIASPAFLMPGRDEQWLADGVPAQAAGKADPEAAKQILEDAGYTMGSDGIYEKDGQKASLKIESVEGWSDNNAASELMVAQVKDAGIELKHETVTIDQYNERRSTGDYQMFFGALFGTPVSDPFTAYRDSFTTEYTQPVGTELGPQQTNYSRYSNAEVDDAMMRAATATTFDEQKEAYDIVQKNIVEDVPYLVMFHAGSQTFYNQIDFTGWPTEDDLYAFPAAWDGVSAAYILSNLEYK